MDIVKSPFGRAGQECHHNPIVAASLGRCSCPLNDQCLSRGRAKQVMQIACHEERCRMPFVECAYNTY
jgi:hypothetical protein